LDEVKLNNSEDLIHPTIFYGFDMYKN